MTKQTNTRACIECNKWICYKDWEVYYSPKLTKQSALFLSFLIMWTLILINYLWPMCLDGSFNCCNTPSSRWLRMTVAKTLFRCTILISLMTASCAQANYKVCTCMNRLPWHDFMSCLFSWIEIVWVVMYCILMIVALEENDFLLDDWLLNCCECCLTVCRERVFMHYINYTSRKCSWYPLIILYLVQVQADTKHWKAINSPVVQLDGRTSIAQIAHTEVERTYHPHMHENWQKP